MEKIRVVMTMYKETLGSYHYKVPLGSGMTPVQFPTSDLYIRKVHFNGRKPPNGIVVEVKEVG